MKKLNLLVIFIMMTSLLLPTMSAMAAPANDVALTNSGTCPDGGDWVKVDGLSGLTYTYTPPEGYEVSENCMKVGSHDPNYGSGPTVTNNTLYNSPGGATCTAPGVPHAGCSLQSISHASFKLVPIEEPEICDDPEAINFEQEGECEYDECQVDCEPEICEDLEAINYGEEGDCEYEECEQDCEPELCEDPEAINFEQEGDCEYDEPECTDNCTPSTPVCKGAECLNKIWEYGGYFCNSCDGAPSCDISLSSDGGFRFKGQKNLIKVIITIGDKSITVTNDNPNDDIKIVDLGNGWYEVFPGENQVFFDHGIRDAIFEMFYESGLTYTRRAEDQSVCAELCNVP